jgi:LytS/YehU family sensor histidine kinase
MILARLARRGDDHTSATAGVPVGPTTLTEETLQIWVRDTGVGASERELARGRTHGIGLQNVERRIKRHYGDAATFGICSASGVGTTVELDLPINLETAAVGGMTPRDLQQTSTRAYG